MTLSKWLQTKPGPIKKVNDETIRKLRTDGLSIRGIAKKLGIPHTTVQSSLMRTKKII